MLKKYHRGTLNSDEKEELSSFLSNEEGKRLLYKVWNDDIDLVGSNGLENSKEKIFGHILQDERISRPSKPRRIVSFSYRKFAAAAVLLLVGGMGYIFWSKGEHEERLAAIEQQNIVPGTKNAHMQFEDGTILSLDKIKEDTVLLDKGLKVRLSTDGNISYEVIDKKLTSTYTTIYTPVGGEYTLMLSDGSQVWLNSDSRITYPIMFAEDHREVQMEGEAYFKIVRRNGKKGKIPFVVKIKNQLIEVLGTEFNVNAYSEKVYTTLVEGAVALSSEKGKEKLLLSPDQQAEFNPQTGEMSKRNIDTYYFTAWRIGKFAFQRASIKKVMEDLARWYNIDVLYQGDFAGITYSGTISRMEEFSEVLKLIEMTNKIKFKIDGRRVTVIKI